MVAPDSPDCPLTRIPISYSKYSLANMGRTGTDEADTASLGKRLLKDYFDGVDVGIYARKAFQVTSSERQAQKLLEKFESIETAADFRHLKHAFMKEVVGSVEKLKGGSVEFDEEEEENEEAIDQYSEGVEESDYSNENSEFDHNSDSNQIAPLN